MIRLLWVKKPGYVNKKFRFLEKEQHCGNCARRGRNGCFAAIVLKETDDTVTVQSRYSGVETAYPKTFVNSKGMIENLIIPNLTNHRNWKKFQTLKGNGKGTKHHE